MGRQKLFDQKLVTLACRRTALRGKRHSKSGRDDSRLGDVLRRCRTELGLVRPDQLASKPVGCCFGLHWVFEPYGLPQDARTPRTLKGANAVVWRA